MNLFRNVVRIMLFCLLLQHAVTLPSASAQALQGGQADPFVAAAEHAEGILATATWQSIFNGKDLAGWRGDTAGYAIEDGVLVCKKGGKTLETEVEYGDFALTFEFRLEASGNNGIGIRVPQSGYPSRDGLEIQILDHDGPLYGHDAEIAGAGKQRLTWLKPWQVHGSVYGIAPARTGASKPVGEWNSETIIAIEDHVMVILNGTVIVDAFLDDMAVIDGSPHPGKHNRRGHIVLAGHDDRVEFRNLRVADYSPAPPSLRAAKDNVPPPGFEALFNGRNLGSGGLWNNRQWRNMPLVLADKKPGEWNTFFIRMVGEKVSVWLNDTLVVDRVKLEDYWSKGTKPLPRADQIELQHHGSELFFKNIFLRELPW